MSVTSVVKMTKQPRGGFIPNKLMDKKEIEITEELNEYEKGEDIGSPVTIGLAIDYLSRLVYSKEKVEDVFDISIRGYELVHKKQPHIKEYNDLSDESIRQAYILSQYDSAVRAGFYDIIEKEPNRKVIEDIRTLTQRTLDFYESLDNVSFHPTFEDLTGEGSGGYTFKCSSGDGDFLSKDTLWDLKVSKTKPNKDHTLQVLLYFLMGKASGQKKYEDLTHIGIFNPKLNTKFTYQVDNLSQETLSKIYELCLQMPIVIDDKEFWEENNKYFKVIDEIKPNEKFLLSK